jgi:beta-glucanase (GH16 family)
MASNLEDCDCGFIDSHDPTKSTFTSLFLVNFTSITRKQFDKLFFPATYQISQMGSPYSRNFSAQQVQLSDTGLELTVSPSPDSKRVPCAQILTRAATFFYGSYHAQFRVGDVPGTVTAFFNYRNNSSEVDLEYLSARDPPALLYSVKPQNYNDDGSQSNSTYEEEGWNDTSISFDQNFHEWSYVWLPDAVLFGLDGKYDRRLSANIPQASGTLALSHWSDGNPRYSHGPPKQNSTATISLLWAIYNDTKANALACKKTTSACNVANGILQAQNPSTGDGGGSAMSPSVVHVGSAHFVGLEIRVWLFVLFFFSLFRCWRSL